MQTTEVQVTVETAKNLGLSLEEFERIKEILHRDPNFTELRIFAVMWSDQCSFKNSIYWLNTLPKEGERILIGKGEENTGLVDLGDEIACTIKIEPHNSPSTTDPFHYTSTRFGGIHPSLFTTGVRPIAALNTIRFGNIDLKQTQQLMHGVASKIEDYRNHFEVPSIGGAVYFNDCYNQNILINTMSVGLVKVDEHTSAIADGPGNPVFIVGITATSIGHQEDFIKDFSSTQIGEPSQEKLLLDTSLAAIKVGTAVGMHDIGVGGIARTTSEMSAKSGTGIRIDLDKVPTSQSKPEAGEVLLSANQERILIVGVKGLEDQLLEIYEKRDLTCVQIGVVTDTGYLEFYQHDELVAHLPAHYLVLGGGAPVYQPKFETPTYLKKNRKFRLSKLSSPKDYLAVAKKIFTSPNILSKKRVLGHNAIDTEVFSDAGLIQIEERNKALAVTSTCNSAYVFADPFIGTMIAVAEAARNIVCSGGEPIAISHCLNFGNPHDKEVYWQFIHAIKGMGEACRKFGTPVIGENVSFYNQSVINDQIKPIFPSPIIGMVGLLDDIETKITIDFKNEGDQIYMIGTPHNDVGSSEYLRMFHGIEHSPVPRFDLDEEYHIQQKIKVLNHKGIISSAHDISEGGLFVSLLESAMVNNLGFDIDTDTNFRKDAYLFGESQSRIVITVSQDSENRLVRYLNSNNLPFTHLGEVAGTQAIIDQKDFGPIEDWKAIYNNRLVEEMEMSNV